MDAVLSGVAKLEQTLRDLAKDVENPATLKVGFLQGARYPDGTSVAMVAAINEFGAPSRGQPPRPFFRNMIRDKSKEWGPALAVLLKANDMDAKKSLEQAGAAIAGQLRQSITDLTSPPLKPSTIRRKGFDKPLIDTGHMLASVDFEVEG